MQTDSVGYHLNSDGLVDVSQGDPIVRTFILLVQTSRELTKYKDAAFFRGAGLSDIKYIALEAIYHNTGVAITPSMIAQWTQTEPHNITTLIRRMQKDGLIIANRNKDNKRFVNITITEKGRESLNQAKSTAREIVKQVMSSLSEEDVTQLEKHLRLLRSNTRQARMRLTKSHRQSAT